MWDLPGPGIEPVSPALAGGFLTTVPPGKFLGYPTLRAKLFLEFPGGPVVKTPYFHCLGSEFDPWPGS